MRLVIHHFPIPSDKPNLITETKCERIRVSIEAQRVLGSWVLGGGPQGPRRATGRGKPWYRWYDSLPFKARNSSRRMQHKLLMKFQPLQLGRRPEPFSHQDWLFEIKYDGFRALAQIEHGRCKLISRNGNQFKSFRTLSSF